MLRRSRGRPRTRQLEPDRGTVELQQKRLMLQQFVGDQPACLGGSILHTFLAMGWIDEPVFRSALQFARLMHQAHRSMGLPLHIKSILRPRGSPPETDEKAEQQWRELMKNLKVTCTQDEIHFLKGLVTATATTWPTKAQTITALAKLHKAMETFPLKYP